ncbi:MAG: 23S rRNA (uracil(1939)-C(5))-methyltransferase RlmD [Endomicrobia bacterium]|nr:23S rRNA (uracil(1939)-C(5))-methyltransferase RlmD [Bacillota bacterium]MCL1972857.1 23S rRNA (uracil(1939)-C(5))-methyltransferase RlmD [Endomicrobiia bacterium]
MSLKNKTISVKAEKIVFPGRSLCRCEDGIALFTEGLLPGEIADVLVIKDKKSFREGLIKQITLLSPERVEPVCPSFGRCGGCTFQNTDYANQSKYKKEYINELLSVFGVKIDGILQSPEIWNYRNKMEFSFFNNETAADLGLHCRGSFNRYVSVPPCFIADEDFLKAALIVKNFADKNGLPAYNTRTHEGFFRHLVLRKAKNNNQMLINIVTNILEGSLAFFEPLVKELGEFAQSIYWTQNGRQSDAVVSDKLTLLFGKEHITEKLNVGGRDFYFNISPFSFFQTNSKGTEILYNEVLRQLNPSKNDVLLDLYCGTGTIGICMADKVKKVIGIEQVESAIENAKTNAGINNVDNAEFFASTAEKWIKENGSVFDAIVVDPPRSGLTNDVIKFLLDSQSKKIVYVSCNPSTLARDLTSITDSGKYKIKEIAPVDMFPQTYHIESVVSLELK